MVRLLAMFGQVQCACAGGGLSTPGCGAAGGGGSSMPFHPCTWRATWRAQVVGGPLALLADG